MAGHSRHRNLEVLREIITHRAHDLVGILALVGDAPLTLEHRNQLRDVLTIEFAEMRCREDDEPSVYGLQVEDLIDFVNRS
jgi:hypothetical protein